MPNRDLNYLDLKRKEFKEKSSKLLLRKRNLFTKKLDDFFNHKIEDTLAKSLPTLLTGSAVISEWKVYRALMLFILLQGGRSAAFHLGKRDLEKLLVYSDSQLDALIHATEQNWKLGSIPAHPQAPLHFPDTGLFSILVTKSPDSLKWVFAVPIHPTRAVILIPNGVTIEMITPSVSEGRLTAWSVGSSAYCRRIIVHPSYLKSHTKDVLRAELLRQRSFVDTQTRLVELRNSLTAHLENLTLPIANPSP